jgi:transcriptional regulator with XRE-family HTH domain
LRDADALSHLGAALAELRGASGLSQEQVAERVEENGKRHQQTRQLRSGTDLHAIERGRKDPTFLMLSHIACAIDVPLATVLAVYDRLGGGGDP